MSTSMDEIKHQFVEQVKLRAYDDKYIDKDEEREILQIAITQGISVDSARQALTQVCENNSYVLESKVLTNLKELVEQFAGNDGVVSQKEFDDALAICKKQTQGKKNEVQCKRMIVEIIEDNGYKVKTGGWFASDWYAAIRKEVGK